MTTQTQPEKRYSTASYGCEGRLVVVDKLRMPQGRLFNDPINDFLFFFETTFMNSLTCLLVYTSLPYNIIFYCSYLFTADTPYIFTCIAYLLLACRTCVR